MSRIFNKYFLKYPLLNLVIIFALSIFGYISAPFNGYFDFKYKANFDILPDILQSQIVVNFSFDNVKREYAVSEISKNLTKKLFSIDGIAHVREQYMSHMGTMFIILDSKKNYQKVKTALDAIIRAYPSWNSISISIGPESTSNNQSYTYVLELYDSNGLELPEYNLHEMGTFHEDYIIPQLNKIHDIEEIAAGGAPEKYFRTLLNGTQIPKHINAYNVHTSHFNQSYNQNKLQYPVYFDDAFEWNLIHNVKKETSNHGISSQDNGSDNYETFISYKGGQSILDYNSHKRVGAVISLNQNANVLKTLKQITDQVAQIEAKLPKVNYNNKELSVRIKSVYDRSELINESSKTFNKAMLIQMLILAAVLLFYLRNLFYSVVAFTVVPLSIGVSFLILYFFGVTNNIMTIGGILIAVGSMTDISIVLVDKVEKSKGEDAFQKFIRSGLIRSLFIATCTTLVSFIPLFFLEGESANIFIPLAISKTIAILSTLFISIWFIASIVKLQNIVKKNYVPFLMCMIYLIALGFFISIEFFYYYLPIVFLIFGYLLSNWKHTYILISSLLLGIVYLYWKPIYFDPGNLLQMGLFILFFLIVIHLFSLLIKHYSFILEFFYKKKIVLFSLISIMVCLGLYQLTKLESQFLPPLDEGDWMVMPVTSPNVSYSGVSRMLTEINKRILTVPEVERVFGKAGRFDSALDPAPLSMFEVYFKLKPEYKESDYFFGSNQRNWRNNIHTKQEILADILNKIKVLGVSSSSILRPIETRQVMLRSGLKEVNGLIVYGVHLDSVMNSAKSFKSELEKCKLLNQGMVTSTLFNDQKNIIIHLNELTSKLHEVDINEVMHVVKAYCGGIATKPIFFNNVFVPHSYEAICNQTDCLDAMLSTPIKTEGGFNLPLKEFIDIEFKSEPSMIYTEDGFLVDYLNYTPKENTSVFKLANEITNQLEENNTENQLSFWALNPLLVSRQSEIQRMIFIILFTILSIGLVLFYYFKSVVWVSLVMSSILVAFSGAIITVWGYNYYFSDHSSNSLGLNLAFGVGFISLLGIATNDSVLLSGYIKENYRKNMNPAALWNLVMEAGILRVRPAVMTTAVTIFSFLPIIFDIGSGSDFMMHLAIPVFGGMVFQCVTIFVLPVLFLLWKSKSTITS